MFLQFLGSLEGRYQTIYNFFLFMGEGVRVSRVNGGEVAFNKRIFGTIYHNSSFFNSGSASSDIPMIITVPTANMFHNFLKELLGSVPDILSEDHNYQGETSKEAIRTRRERLPDYEKK